MGLIVWEGKQIEATIVGNNIYSQCNKCGRMVKLNKRIFGSLHVCDHQREITGQEIAMDYLKRKSK